MQTCPVDGCEDVFSTANGAVMHAINKGDAEHSEIETKADGYERLEKSDKTDRGDTSDPDKTDPDPDPDTNPLHDGPPVDSNGSQSEGSTETTGKTCLSCGSTHVSELDPDRKFRTSDGRMGVTDGGELWCDDCEAISDLEAGEAYE